MCKSGYAQPIRLLSSSSFVRNVKKAKHIYIYFKLELTGKGAASKTAKRRSFSMLPSTMQSRRRSCRRIIRIQGISSAVSGSLKEKSYHLHTTECCE